jgi:hypothetical protein
MYAGDATGRDTGIGSLGSTDGSWVIGIGQKVRVRILLVSIVITPMLRNFH